MKKQRKDTKRSQSRWALVLLFLALVSGTILRTMAIGQKHALIPDEAVSYLAATGHQESYAEAAEAGLSGVWVRAEEWKKFLRPDRFFCFRTIGRDLASFDIHPPLYFWLLHIWTCVLGVRLWTGPALNILIAALTILSLFGLARSLLRHSVEAALVSYAWAVSPAVVLVSVHARQYDLLALAAVLFVWQLLRSADPAGSFSWRDLILLVLAAAGCLLTQYQSIWLVAGGALYAFLILFKKDRLRLLGIAGAMISGLIILTLLHPQFAASFVRQRAQAQPFVQGQLLTRAGNAFYYLQYFFRGEWGWMRYRYLLPFSAVALLVWSIFTARRQGSLSGYLRRTSLVGMSALYFLAWLTAGTFFLYLAFLSPVHAMSPRYLSLVWPFMAFVPVFVLRVFRNIRLPLATFIFLCLIISSFVTIGKSAYLGSRGPDPSPVLQASDDIVVDSVRRGTLLAFLWHVPNDKKVYALPQDKLLAEPSPWLRSLTGSSLYFSDVSHDNTSEKQARILALIRQQPYEVELVKRGIWGVGDLFALREKQDEY